MSSRTQQALTQSFAFKEKDPEGEETLEVMALAPRFNRWMFETIRPYLVSPVLEVGSGIGNLSAQLLDGGFESYLSDVRPGYCDHLHRKFADRPSCRGVIQLDLVHPNFNRVYGELLGRFGTVFALNVVEHIEDDNLAMANAQRLLRPGGRLIVLVPAYRFLYNRLDRELCHFRRHTRGSLNRLFTDNGLDVTQSFYFNLAGTLGWFLSGSLLKRKTPPRKMVWFYNLLVPLFRLIDRLTFRRAGLSVVTVGMARETVRLPAAA